MLYGISTGFGSPQMPVAELLARGLPSLPSQQHQKAKSSNFLQVPDIETPRLVYSWNFITFSNKNIGEKLKLKYFKGPKVFLALR